MSTYKIAIINESQIPSASGESTEKKELLIEVLKNAVYKDIERITFKNTEGNDEGGVKSRNERSADSTEGLDGGLISRYVAFYDAELRKGIRFALAEEEGNYANDRVPLEDQKFVYNLLVPQAFKESTRKAVAEYFHRFLVWGGLVDWYTQFGMLTQASAYERKMDNLLSTIKSMLQPDGYARVPMQPFGPAYKIRR